MRPNRDRNELRRFVGKGLQAVLGKRLFTRFRAAHQLENSYLNKVHGVIHVGANTGQERELYDAFGLYVAWIEPLPEIFHILKSNIAALPRQRAYQYLVADRDDEEHTFNIADNDGASSSIFALHRHKEMWPQINYSGSIRLRGSRLSSIITREHIDLRQFNALVLDTQGAELNILVGSEHILSHFRFVKVEVPDFESYKGCCQISDMTAFMASKGFYERLRTPFMQVPGVGTYFDVLFERTP